MKKVKVDVAVVGAGAGGFGTVYRLVKNKKTVAVVDLLCDFGGTAVFAGVNCWEPGVSSAGVHRKLASLLLKDKFKAGVGKFVPNCNIENLNSDGNYNLDWKEENRELRPFVLSTTFKKEKYINTEKRCYVTNNGGRYYRRFHFKPKAMSDAMNQLLCPYKKYLKRFFNSEYKSCEIVNDKIKSIVVVSGDEQYKIVADYFVDCTGDVVLARDTGVKVALGADSRNKYDEVSCNDDAINSVNGVTQMFVVAKSADSNFITPIPEKYKNIDITNWKENVLYQGNCIGFFNVYPDLSININMLPTMDGCEYISLGEEGKDVLVARVYAYWNYLQTVKNLKGYDIVEIFDEVGVRESYRIHGKYVLTENDIRKGYLNQNRREEFIAYSDHCLDVHGENALSVELDVPFGIPLSCTMVNEYDNLFVASKGISLSHIANSSCRLTRTVMAVGEGVGVAINQLIDSGNIDFKRLRKSLRLDKYEKALSGKRLKRVEENILWE